MNKLLITIVIILIICILASGYICLNTLVSIKYETEFDNCISKVDGRNLCSILKISQMILFGSLILISAVPIIKNRISKTK